MDIAADFNNVKNDINDNNNNTINIYNNDDDYWMIMSSRIFCVFEQLFFVLKFVLDIFEHLYICELDFGSHHILYLDETYVLTAV